MLKILFVGDEPSLSNTHEKVAFVGAKCFNTLVSWIAVLKPDFYLCLNSKTAEDMLKIQKLSKAGFQVVALGAKAQKRCALYLEEPFHKFYHPSGLNRKLNDKHVIKRELENLKSDIFRDLKD